MIGLKIAFQTAPTAAIVPAIPGEIPAIVVKKKSKNTPINPYAAASPPPAQDCSAARAVLRGYGPPPGFPSP